MRISELSARCGVSPATLRYYDTIGLLAPHREPNGYRTYGDDAVERLSFIEAAKHLDLPLAAIAELLDVVEADSCTQVRTALQPRLEQRLAEVDLRIAQLTALRDRLDSASRDVAACPDSGQSCRTECLLLDRMLDGPLDPPSSASSRVAPSRRLPGSDRTLP